MSARNFTMIPSARHSWPSHPSPFVHGHSSSGVATGEWHWHEQQPPRGGPHDTHSLPSCWRRSCRSCINRFVVSINKQTCFLVISSLVICQLFQQENISLLAIRGIRAPCHSLNILCRTLRVASSLREQNDATLIRGLQTNSLQ